MDDETRKQIERLIDITNDSKLDLMLDILHSASDDSDKIDE